jgi:multiple sugar transport system permease protein
MGEPEHAPTDWASPAPAEGPAHPPHRRRTSWAPYLFIAPLMLFIVVLSFYPTAVTFVESFFRVDPLEPPVQFVGLGNYLALLQNPGVILGMENTALYMLFGIVLATGLGLVMALTLWQNFRARSVILAIAILPWALPGIVEGIIWNWIYNPEFGVLNSVLKSLGLIHQYQIWVGTNHLLTIFLIELVQVWQLTPLCMLLILASLQSIPGELFDASRVDGAGIWTTFARIIVPLIRPGLAIALVNAMIGSFNIFDQVYALNGGATLGTSIMMQTYNVTFENLNFGQGYALSFVVTILSMLLSLGFLRVVYRRVEF